MRLNKRISLTILMVVLPVVVMLSLLMMAPVQAQPPTATPTVFPSQTAVPVIGPQVTPVNIFTATPEGGCFPPLTLEKGERAWLKSGVVVRHLPSRSGAPLAYTQENTNVIITDGPVCADTYNWWRVTGTEQSGWVAEGRRDIGYFLFSYEDAGVFDCTPLYDLEVGEVTDLVVNVKVHAAADPASLVKTVAPAGSRIEIIGGSQCIDNYLWWQIRVTVANFTYEGWMAEGQDGLYWLVPDDVPSTEDGTLCADPLNLSSGTEAVVRYRDGIPKYLRVAPGVDSQAMFSLVNNVPLIILDGPVCKDNLNWWKVRVRASTPVIGWIAEGSPGVGYWIRALADAYPVDGR